MPVPAPQQISRRRPKHEPQESEREILEAAEQLLRERPFREVTVARIMLRTGLKRPAFYVHFRDRGDVIVRIVQHVAQEVLDAAKRWLDGDGVRATDMLAALEGVTAVYAKHGPVLRALADAAATDAQTDGAYRAAVESFVDATADRIRSEQATGAIAPDIEARATARALVWLNDRYLYETLGRQPPEDPVQVVAVLQRIWTATLYGGSSATRTP